MTDADWRHSLTDGLANARADSERALRRTLDSNADKTSDSADLPFWWRSTLSKAEWAARRCLESLAETAQRSGPDGKPIPARWLCLERSFRVDLKTPRGPLRLKARCDAVLLDRPEFTGAGGQLIDIRTGATPAVGIPTATQLESGHGLGLGTLLLMGVAEGLDAATTQAGVIYPEAANVAQWTAENAATLDGNIARLAALQRTLVFGQKSAFSGGHSRDDSEELPLATTPVAPAILAAKAALTRMNGDDD